jgi:hypothetical protein
MFGQAGGEIMKPLVLAFGATFFLCSVVLGGDVKKSGKTEIKSIPFSDFMQTCATNEARAEILYEGKQVTVTGKVVRVVTSRQASREQGKDAYLLEMKADESTPSAVCVQFFFDRSERAKLSELQAGQEVAVQGLCGRPAIYSADRLVNRKEYVEVPVRECKVLRAK